jgi:hypothetical protein
VYLRQPPTPAERALAEQVGLHDGAPVPFWMLAKVVLRLFPMAEWDDRFKTAWRRVRRYVAAGAIAAGAHLSAGAIYWLHAHDARVAAEERAAATERESREYRRTNDDKIEQLRLDVRELRRELRRLGIGGPASPDSSAWTLPDRLSSFFDTKGIRPCSQLEPVTLSPPLL